MKYVIRWCLFLTLQAYYSDAMVFTPFSLKQSLNMPAIKMVGSIVRQPSLAMPTVEVSKLADVDFQALKDSGVRCVVFDKDNTLCNTYTDELHPSVRGSMQRVQQLFPSSSVAILSNSVGTLDDEDFAGAKLTESKLGIPVIRHKHKKPGCIEEVLEHFRPSIPEIKAENICMIGDRLLTDIVFANQHKMHSVLVEPLDNYKDHPVAVVMRSIELKVILPLLKACGVKSSDRRW